MKSEIHEIPEIRVNPWIKNEKNRQIKGKITKSDITFSENIPNSPIVQTDLSYLSAINYTISTSLTKVKNKPNQTQFKPNTNPIAKRPKMNVNIYYTKVYNNETYLRAPKTKPIQTQSNPISKSRIRICSLSSSENNYNAKDLTYEMY